MMRTKKAMRRVFALSVFCLLAGGVRVSSAQDGSRPLKPADAVRPQVFLSLEPVPQGRRFEIAVVAQVAEGYHVQANKVFEDYLIPLTVTAELPAGFKLLNTTYPKAQVKKFPFAAQPMAVYEGRFVVRLNMEAGASVPAGPTTIPMTLRFQACNDQLCLPPAKQALAAEFEVAAAGAAAKAVHSEIFRKE
jgi:cytochrome c biogenesis DsbD-like protein